MIEEVANSKVGSVRAYAKSRRARGLPGGTHRAVQVAIRRQRLVACVGADGLIDFEQADREWAQNTDHAKGPLLRPTASAVVDVRIPIDRLSLWVDDYRDGEAIVVLALGNVDHSQQIDLDSSWCIPMTPTVARLVGAKLLSLAHEAGEDISELFAHPGRRVEGVRQLLREARG